MTLAALTWRSTELWPVVFAFVVLLSTAVAYFYPDQVRAMPRPWRWLLPALRIGALGALALSVLRPVVIRARSTEEQGAVVILLDRSRSMSAVDRTIGPFRRDRGLLVGQLVALADALGRLPAGVRLKTTAALDQEIAKLTQLADDIVRIRQEVDYARLSGRDPAEPGHRLESSIQEFLKTAKTAEGEAKKISPRSEMVEGLAKLHLPPKAAAARENWIRTLPRRVSESAGARESQDTLNEDLYNTDPQVRAICDELAGMSRFELCWQALVAEETGLVARLGKDAPLVGFTLGARVSPLALKTEPHGSGALGEPEELASDLSGGLRSVLQKLAARPVQAIVLLSDGRQWKGEGAIPSGVVGAGVPIFTIWAASPRMRDLAIQKVELPSSVFVGQPFSARVAIRDANIDPSQIAGDVTLSAPQLAPMTQPIVRDKHLDSPSFSLRFDTPGIKRLVFSLTVQDGEASATNNTVERWVKVLSRKTRVTAISTSAGWDWRYLCDLLSRTPWVDLRQVMIGDATPPDLDTRELRRQDLLILCDVTRDTLSSEQWAAVREMIFERGGSALVIPGAAVPPSFPPGHVMAEMLPFVAETKPVWRTWSGQSAHYRISATGAPWEGEIAPTEPILRAGDPSPSSESILREGDLPGAPRSGPAALSSPSKSDTEDAWHGWDDLPPFYRYLWVPQLKPESRVLLLESESKAPLLTETRCGRGRTLLLGINETWRWRNRVGGRDQERFWMQLLRYTADDPYSLSQGALAVDIDRPVIEPDQAVRVRARLALRGGRAAPPAALDLTLLRDGEIVESLKMAPVDARGDGRYSAILSQLSEREYDVRVSLPPGEDSAAALTIPLRVARNVEPEMSELAGNQAFLQSLSEATGGKCIKIEELVRLPQLIDEVRLRQPRTSEVNLWDSGYLFVFVLSCLTAEWALRKRFGLA